MTKDILFVILAMASLDLGCGGSDDALKAPADDEARPAMALSLAVQELEAGGSSTGTVQLRDPAPEEGAEIALASTEMSLSLPPVIVVAPAEQAATFVFTNQYNGQPKEVLITADSGGATARAMLYVPKLPFDVPPCSVHGCNK
jgi:hypothetical protein